MKPLIKWPGGKTSELNQFLPLVPEYDRYIEPFFGGGAMYFALNPPRAVIGDTSDQLIGFYRMVQSGDQEFRRLLMLYNDTFAALRELCRVREKEILALYELYAYAQEKELPVQKLGLHKELTRQIAMDETVMSELILDPDEYLAIMQDSVEDKLIRTVKNNENDALSAKVLKNSLVTGFLGGYYLYHRGVFNSIASGHTMCTNQYKIANFYFIREYCYGSMFRYNNKGEFNVPYGGNTYNTKDLLEKIEAMFSDQAQSLLRRTQISCEDFEALLRRLRLTQRDFIFLDPPYDTDFSEYEGRDFHRKDQERLAAFLHETQAQFVLVIKNSDYIYDLYKDSFRIMQFENQYVYNIRSRNERTAQHLIITNIPEGQVPWIRENYEEN